MCGYPAGCITRPLLLSAIEICRYFLVYTGCVAEATTKISFTRAPVSLLTLYGKSHLTYILCRGPQSVGNVLRVEDSRREHSSSSDASLY